MSDFIKYAIGIDCAKDELVCCCSAVSAQMVYSDLDQKSFPNSPKGFNALFKWAHKLTGLCGTTCFVIEATGVYHEDFAFFCDEKGLYLSVVLPSKIKHYRKSLDIKTDTDRSAAIGIAHFGLARKLDKWQRPSQKIRSIRSLTRERNQVMDESTAAKNALHALKHSYDPHPTTVKRLKARIKFCAVHLKEIEMEIRQAIKSDSELKQRIDNLCTIKGVGLITAITIVAETDGFSLIRNKRQLVSYAGLDVVERQSGTSIKGKSRISKRGNKQIRKALYFPAMTAIKHNTDYKQQYIRIVSKTGIRMKGQVAIQRKLLVLIYTIWKKNEPFNPDFSSITVTTKKSGQSSLTDPTELTHGRPMEQNY